MPPPVARNPVRDAIGSLVVLSLLAGVYLLEPDTSLREVRASGVLRACLPERNPPLVIEAGERPGADVELLRALAQRMGVALAITPVPAMAQDFNPRNWRITRAQCEALGGGVVDSDLTRSFLDTFGPHGETGWAVVAKQQVASLQGRRVAVLASASGLDRLALSRELRAASATAILTQDAAAFVARIRDGEVEAGVMERLGAEQIAHDNGWTIAWAPGDLPRHRVAFGLWKGDLTLKRALTKAWDDLARDGTQAQIMARYGVGSAQ